LNRIESPRTDDAAIEQDIKAAGADILADRIAGFGKCSMNRYIGTKVINATPMTRADYNTYRGWVMPFNENGDDEGYLVEYLDGGKGNDSRHAGYISWSPKAQFEAAYLEVSDVSGMPPHVQRMHGEVAQLDEKRNKLHAFINGNRYWSEVPTAEQGRLIAQLQAMSAYSEVLWARIKATPTTPQL
jgi:hypothetical protein